MLNAPIWFQDALVRSGVYSETWYSPHYVAQAQIQKAAFGQSSSLAITLNVSPTVVEQWLRGGLGRHVQFYDTGLSVVWEGFVNVVTGQVGQRTTTVGPLIGGVANKIKVSYSYIDTSGVEPILGGRITTDWGHNLQSQAKYGILERVLSVSGSTAPIAAQIRDTALAEMAWPHIAESDAWGGTGETKVVLECLGYIHWLDAYVYNSTNTGTTNASTKVANVLAADPNGVFSTATMYLATNTTQVSQWEDEDRAAMTVIKGIVSQGDSSFNRWLFYLRPGRIAHYHAKPTTEVYYRAVRDPDQAVRRAAGQAVVEPWTVTPGNWMLYTDFMITEGATEMSQDVRYSFLEQTRLNAPWGLAVQGNVDYRLDRLLAQLGLGGMSV